MEFNYSALSTAVTFIDGSEVYNSLSNQINITLSNGSVSQEELPIVLSQPASQTIQLNDQAIFTVEATGVEAYQWQVSSDEGQSWMDLTNTIPYYNVTTETLTIDPVTWDLEGYQYACLLIGEYCTISSDAAVLNVDTLTSAGGQWSQRREWLSISPNPAKDIVTLAYWSKSPCQAEISIYTLTGTIIKILEKETLQRGENSLQVDLQSIEPGFYLVTLKPLNSADKGIRRAKMIKVSN
jgi:hypothetical protein